MLFMSSLLASRVVLSRRLMGIPWRGAGHSRPINGSAWAALHRPHGILVVEGGHRLFRHCALGAPADRMEANPPRRLRTRRRVGLDDGVTVRPLSLGSPPRTEPSGAKYGRRAEALGFTPFNDVRVGVADVASLARRRERPMSCRGASTRPDFDKGERSTSARSCQEPRTTVTEWRYCLVFTTFEASRYDV